MCICARAGRGSRGVRRSSQFPAHLNRFRRTSICHTRGTDGRWRYDSLTTSWLEAVNVTCFMPRIPDLPRFYAPFRQSTLSSAAAGACRGNVQRDPIKARSRPASHGGEDTASRREDFRSYSTFARPSPRVLKLSHVRTYAQRCRLMM